jgi:FHA domain
MSDQTVGNVLRRHGLPPAPERKRTIPWAAFIRTPVRGIFHFHGVDDTGRKFGFDLEMDQLVKRRQSVLIGRDSSQCDVVLLNTSVSRRHARLSVGSDNTLQIEDVGSTNGTAINGTRLAPWLLQPLEAGSTLKVGDLELVVHYD